MRQRTGPANHKRSRARDSSARSVVPTAWRPAEGYLNSAPAAEQPVLPKQSTSDKLNRQQDTMNKENIRPKFRLNSGRRSIRHHNPGTRRRASTPRVRILSSVTVVPPYDVNIPHGSAASSTPPIPDTDPIWTKPPPLPPPMPWVTPPDMEEPPTDTSSRRDKALNPQPKVNYPEEFEIVPGEAYCPVPWYVNRDLPWRVNPIDIPPVRRVRFYRDDTKDPRMHDLRVEVTRADEKPPTPDPVLFETPRRPRDQSTSSGEVLDNLIRLLDQTYGCPRPTAPTPPETGPERPSTSPRTPQPSYREAPDLSDSLRALVQLAKLFAGPRDSTEDAYRKFKRPHCRRRE